MHGVFFAEVTLSSPEAADAELKRLREENPGLLVQLMSMKRRPNRRAVEMIALQTLRAAKKGSMIATKPEVDLLLRLAGTAQISEAIERVGYRAGGRRFLVAVGNEEMVKRLEAALTSSERGRNYRPVPEERLDERGSEMVESAALLGLRR